MIYNTIVKYKVKVETTQPLCIGSDEVGEILKHPVTNMPYVPATSMLGIWNHYIKQCIEQGDSEHGTRENDGTKKEKKSYGTFIMSDGTFEDTSIQIEVRDHVKINGERGVAENGQKFSQEVLSKNARFTFYIEYMGKEKDEIEEVHHMIQRCLNGMKSGEIVLGGKTSQGFGKMDIVEVSKYQYNMMDKEDRDRYVNDNHKYETVDLDECDYRKIYRFFTLNGKATQSLLVKSVERLKGKLVNKNLQDGRGDYIIPGSTIKGVFRYHIEKILSVYANENTKKEILDMIFGSTGQEGVVSFTDTVMGTQEENERVVEQNRIRIDYFTGGVFHGALVNNKPAKGEITLVIRQKNDHTNQSDWITALLLLTLRDIQQEVVAFGGSSSIGNGFLSVDKIELYDNEAIEVYPIGSTDKIKVYLQALETEVKQWK